MKSSRNNFVWQIINLVTFLATLVINTLANILPLGGRTTGEVSDIYFTYFTPANFTFSIWGVIYTLLGLFVIYQVLPSQKESSYLQDIGPYFALGGIANTIWLFLWHYDFIPHTLPFMFVLLASLIMIYIRLGVGKRKVTTKEQFLVHLPFSIYLGWITVAPIANVASTLIWAGWDGGGIDPIIWTLLVIAIAAVITLMVIWTRKDIGYSLVILWAAYGIYIRQAAVPLISNAALAVMVIIPFGLAISLIYHRSR